MTLVYQTAHVEGLLAFLLLTLAWDFPFQAFELESEPDGRLCVVFFLLIYFTLFFPPSFSLFASEIQEQFV